MSTRRDPVEMRFWDKVEKTATCWAWRSVVMSNGYGVFSPGRPRRRMLAHRFAYEFLRGPIPEGLDIDHLCRNRRCVNPDHLEPVTRQMNLLRGLNGNKTVCLRGHPYDEQNTRWQMRPDRLGGKSRECRTCCREKHERRRLAKATP